MNDNFRFIHSDCVPYPILSISFSDIEKAVPYIIKNQILGLNIGDVFDKPDFQWSLDPIKECAGLKTLYISGAFRDFSSVTHLDLEDLSMDLSFSKERISLDSFPNLRFLSIMKYSPRVTGISRCQKLEYVQIWNYCSKNNNLSEFQTMRSLNHLSLIRPRIVSLQGIESCANIRELKIGYARGLRDISAAKSLNGLEKVELYNCKAIQDFSCFTQMESLRFLIIDHCNAPKDMIPDRSEYDHVWIKD